MVTRVEREDAATEAGAVTIVLADDHEVVRNGLRMVLEAEEDFQVVAEAGDLDATRRYVLAHRPAVLVLDLNMPEGSSLPAIGKLLEQSPQTAVVVLTMQQDVAFAREALRSGALGYNRVVAALRADRLVLRRRGGAEVLGADLPADLKGRGSHAAGRPSESASGPPPAGRPS